MQMFFCKKGCHSKPIIKKPYFAEKYGFLNAWLLELNGRNAFWILNDELGAGLIGHEVDLDG